MDRLIGQSQLFKICKKHNSLFGKINMTCLYLIALTIFCITGSLYSMELEKGELDLYTLVANDQKTSVSISKKALFQSPLMRGFLEQSLSTNQGAK